MNISTFAISNVDKGRNGAAHIEQGVVLDGGGIDIAQAFALGQLGENQTNERCPAGEMPNFVIAEVTADTAVKLLSVDRRENL